MTSEQGTIDGDKPVFCAHCGTQNPGDVYSCDRCGERIYLPDPQKPPPMGLVECQSCVTPNESRASYCVNCGNSLANAARITILGSGDTERRAPHTQPGGIRLRQRERGTVTRPAPEQPKPPQQRPARKPPSAVPPRSVNRTRDEKQDRRQREAARVKAVEQERARVADSEGENTSGNDSARLPESARGWNTAAFLLGPIWGPANGVWFGILGLVFLVMPDSVMALGFRILLYLGYGTFLGLRGNELAWRRRRWNSLDQFKRVQQQWMLLALVVSLLLLVFVVPIMLR